jgi:hypothetical protein
LSLKDHVGWVTTAQPTHADAFSRAGVTPAPSGQRDFNLGFATLGVDESHLGFAVLLSALIAIAHSVSGDDSKVARTVTPLNATPLNVRRTPIPVGI